MIDWLARAYHDIELPKQILKRLDKIKRLIFISGVFQRGKADIPKASSILDDLREQFRFSIFKKFVWGPVWWVSKQSKGRYVEYKPAMYCSYAQVTAQMLQFQSLLLLKRLGTLGGGRHHTAAECHKLLSPSPGSNKHPIPALLMDSMFNQ